MCCTKLVPRSDLNDSVSWCVKNLDRLDLTEKVAEVLDESFHLFHGVVKSYASVEIFELFRDIHTGAHQFEHLLHCTCLINDIIDLTAYFTIGYHHVGIAEVAAKINQFIAHLLAPIVLLSDLKILKIGAGLFYVEGAIPIFSAIGHSISSISHIWKKQFDLRLAIQLSGVTAQSIAIVKHFTKPAASVYAALSSIQALAGLFHAVFIIYRLLPDDDHCHLI